MMRKPNALALAFVVFVLAIAGIGGQIRPVGAATQLPLRTIDIILARDLREQYVIQIRKFSDTYAFAIRVSQSSPDPDDILVQLWREDVKLIAVNGSDTGASDLTYFIGIYENGDHPIPVTAVDQLVEGLRDTVGQIEGAIFTITK